MSAVKSTVTSKYQTTVPRAIRKHLGIGPQDVLIAVGLGDAVEDVRRVRRTRGAETT